VETPYGYHILKRPGADAVRQKLLDYLESTVTMQLDSLYRDSLATSKKLELTGSAVPLMRAAIQDPEANRKSGKAVATYQGGNFTVADFLRWVFALPPQYVSQLQQADEEQLKEIARVFAQNAILLTQADSAGISLTSTEWAGLVYEHRAEVDSLRNSLGLGSEISDSGTSLGERSRLAALRLDTYFSDLVSFLRRQGNFRVNEAGLARAVELSEAKQRADSTLGADSATRSLQRDSMPRPDTAGARTQE
jgi:hypothetical protein